MKERSKQKKKMAPRKGSKKVQKELVEVLQSVVTQQGGVPYESDALQKAAKAVTDFIHVCLLFFLFLSVFFFFFFYPAFFVFCVFAKVWSEKSVFAVCVWVL